ncbi:MAG: ABC transporter ATP-binding protein [Planctomycetes bacterium]|nr:ABC transporter ATP-binding protein [Planctomycetota bacterium]
MITVTDLTKRFGPTLAVDRLSFAVERGEIVGFLGPNGAGKTTTIRVLAGYHPATSGRATVAGFDVARHSLQVRQQLGYLPENVPIYPELRVVEYLRYRAALKGVPAKERKAAVARAMAKAGVEDVRRKLVGNVSRGYRQRVGLADALVANPPVLILDEPTSGLDPNQRRRIKDVVRELAAEHTVLFSSHILAEVQDVASRILIIHRGRLRADGPPDELVGHSVGRRLVVSAFCEAPRLCELVAALPGVNAAEFAAGPERSVVVTAELAEGSDPRAALGQQLAGAAIPVRELRIDVPSLEEYFHLMTEGADRAAEVGEGAA